MQEITTTSSPYEEVMESENFLPFHLYHLTPQIIQKAKEELNENENTSSSSIEELRKLIIKEKNLKCRMDDEFLLQFLRARKFNLEKAFTRLQTFYQVFSKSFADVYSNIDDERAKKNFGSGLASHLPYRDREGAAVILIKMSNWTGGETDVSSIMNCFSAVVLSAVDYPATQVCGLQFLIDAKGTSFRHMRCLTPRYLHLMSKTMRDTIPARFKGFHIINASAIFRYLWGMITFFLSEKITKRIHFHDYSMESLHKFIPKEILPEEYSGDNSNFDPIKQVSAELEKFLPKYLQIIHAGYKTN